MISPQYLQFIQMMLQRQGMPQQAPQQGLFNPQATRPMYRNYAGMFPQMAPMQQQTQAQTQARGGMPDWYANVPQNWKDRFPMTGSKNIPFPLQFLFGRNGQ